MADRISRSLWPKTKMPNELNSSSQGDSTPKNRAEVLDYYRQKLEAVETEVRDSAGQWSAVGIGRGLLLLASIALGLMASVDAFGLRWTAGPAAAIVFVVFVLVALYHEGLETKMRQGKMLIAMHRESLARMTRQWKHIQMPKVEIPDWFSATSKDLDLLGDSSVFKLLGITRTPLGTQTLKDWIIEGADPAEVEKRQAAVAELKPQFDWRLKFRFECEQLADSQSGPSRFVDWAESKSWFASQTWVLWLARITSVASLIGIVGAIAGLLGFGSASLFGIILAVSCATNFLLSVAKAGSIHEIFDKVSSRSNDAARYITLFDMIADHDAKSDRLRELQTPFAKTGDGAQAKMKNLGSLISLANLRRSGSLYVFYIILEFMFFWDVHALDLLERWKEKNGGRARQWFSDLGQMEALAAIAKLAGDEPEWEFPTVFDTAGDSEVIVAGDQVGHPLLDESRVCNDVQLGPVGTVLLVTGSNMSGKSTLLRSIGANIVLAQLGSVVCSKNFRTPPVRIETSMRIADSLADGVSFFMAELKRLKEIVDTAKEHASDNPRRLLFLLDEILQGTNSVERQVAVSRVVRKLIDEKAIGAISTHDLDLADTSELAAACQTVHFSEQFVEKDGKKTMTFDYQMKPGIAQTTNALKLLEIVGLGD